MRMQKYVEKKIKNAKKIRNRSMLDLEETDVEKDADVDTPKNKIVKSNSGA